jgi:hypothetical protein
MVSAVSNSGLQIQQNELDQFDIFAALIQWDCCRHVGGRPSDCRQWRIFRVETMTSYVDGEISSTDRVMTASTAGMRLTSIELLVYTAALSSGGNA